MLNRCQRGGHWRPCVSVPTTAGADVGVRHLRRNGVAVGSTEGRRTNGDARRASLTEVGGRCVSRLRSAVVRTGTVLREQREERGRGGGMRAESWYNGVSACLAARKHGSSPVHPRCTACFVDITPRAAMQNIHTGAAANCGGTNIVQPPCTP